MRAPLGDPCYLHHHPLLSGQVCFKDPGFLLLLPLSDCSRLQGLFLAACLLKIALSCLELRHKR